MTFDQHFFVLLFYYLLPGLIALFCGTLIKRRAQPAVLRFSATVLQIFGGISVAIIAIILIANLLGI